MDRRTMIASCLCALALTRRSAPARAAGTGYRELLEPVRIPLAEVEEAWHPRPFVARAPAPPSDGRRDAVRLPGALLRLPARADEEPAAGLRVFCLTCPHEACRAEFVEDTAWVRVDAAPKPEHPLFVCACHFSAFDPVADGSVIAGPAHRGLYRFRFEALPGEISIDAVEEEALRHA